MFKEIKTKWNDKTNSTSHRKFYRFLRMTVALQIPPSLFEQTNYVAVSVAGWQFYLVYLHNIAVFFRSASKKYGCKCALTIFSVPGLELKLGNCNFLTKSTDLQHGLIRLSRLRTALKKMDALKVLNVSTECYHFKLVPGLM